MIDLHVHSTFSDGTLTPTQLVEHAMENHLTAFALTEGYEVFLCDINEEFAANGKKKIAKGFEKRIAKGKMTQETADAVLAFVRSTALR